MEANEREARDYIFCNAYSTSVSLILGRQSVQLFHVQYLAVRCHFHFMVHRLGLTLFSMLFYVFLLLMIYCTVVSKTVIT